MKITISDPTEPDVAGYWTVHVEEDNELMAEMHAAPDLLADLDDADALRELAEGLEQAADAMEATDT